MRLYFLSVLSLSALLIAGASSAYTVDEALYLDILKYGTDMDIVQAFSTVREGLGGEVNKKVLDIFKEMHAEKVYSVLARYIGMAKISDAQEILLQELEKKGKNDDYREELIYALAELGNSASLKPLSKVYEEKQTSKRIKKAVLDAFGKLGDGSVEGTLMAVVKDVDEDTDVRARAVLALGELRSERSFDILKDLLWNRYEDKILRMYSAAALSKIGGPGALSALSEVLYDETHEVAEYAVNGIAEQGTGEAGDLLIKALRSDYDKVRYYAVIGLSRMRYGKAAAILGYKAEHDSNEAVRREAKKALEALAGAGNNVQDGSVEE